MPEFKHYAGGCTCCVVLIVSVILFAVSWSSLEPTEIGLDVNGNTMTVDETKIHPAGRYLLGLGHWFIRFNTTLQTITLSGAKLPGDLGDDKELVALSAPVAARTIDGLPVQLHLSFQYKLINQRKEIVALYRAYGEEYRKAFQRIARDAVRNVAAEFTGFEFFKNRTQINTLMLVRVDHAIRSQHASVETFQVLNIKLPNAFDAAIQKTEVTRQEKIQAQNERDTARISAETRVLQAEQDAQIVLVSANATAEATLIQSEANAAAIKSSIDGEAAAFSLAKSTMSLTTPNLLGYIWLRAVTESHGKMTINVERPAGV